MISSKAKCDFGWPLLTGFGEDWDKGGGGRDREGEGSENDLWDLGEVWYNGGVMKTIDRTCYRPDCLPFRHTHDECEGIPDNTDAR